MARAAGGVTAAPALPRRLAILFAGAGRRAALEALYAVDDQIAIAVRPGIEHAAAHAKLGWWRSEVDRLAAARPLHPASRALYNAAGDGLDYRLLQERLAAADLELVGFAPGTLAELDALLYRSHGAVQQLAAQLLGGRRDAALDAFGAALGRGLGLADWLAGTPVEGRSRGPFDRDELAARARAALATADGALPPAARRAQAHGFVLAALAAARLGPHRSAPLPQLWTAWRAARRCTSRPPGADP
jgi:phytoene synthase